jgi:tetratricopeptide (TPR) repeat protein
MAIQAQPNEELYRSRATIFMLKEDYKNSIFDFTRALRLNTKDVQAYMGRANVYLLNNKEEQAYRDLESALESSEDAKSKYSAHAIYALALISREKLDKALFHYEKLIQIEPTSGAYRRKGNILFAQNKFEEARESYEQSLKLDTENPYSYLGRGKLYLIEGDYKKAILDFEKALSIKHYLCTLRIE